MAYWSRWEVGHILCVDIVAWSWCTTHCTFAGSFSPAAQSKQTIKFVRIHKSPWILFLQSSFNSKWTLTNKAKDSGVTGKWFQTASQPWQLYQGDTHFVSTQYLLKSFSTSAKLFYWTHLLDIFVLSFFQWMFSNKCLDSFTFSIFSHTKKKNTKKSQDTKQISVLGNSGGVVVHWLLLLLVRTFFIMEGGDSELANFMLPILKAFFEAHSHNVSGNKLELVARAIGCPQMHFFYKLVIIWSAKNDAKTLFAPSIPFPR